MSEDSNDQNEDNEFINNFHKKFITLPKHIQKIQHTFRNDTSITNQDIQRMQIDHQANSPTQILEISRGKVINSHSMKSLNHFQQDQNHLEKSSSISRLKAKKEKVEKILSNRFLKYKQKLSKSINKLESICEQNFGGLQNINRQMSKHKLSRQDLVEYYVKMLPKNTDFPKIIEKYKNPKEQSQKLPKLGSLSQQHIPFFGSQAQSKHKKQLKHNKWYIDPQKRFSINKDKTLYDWRTEEGVRNVIRTQQLRIKSKEINQLIKEVKQKFHREPIFCKYVKIT